MVYSTCNSQGHWAGCNIDYDIHCIGGNRMAKSNVKYYFVKYSIYLQCIYSGTLFEKAEEVSW